MPKFSNPGIDPILLSFYKLVLEDRSSSPTFSTLLITYPYRI